MLGGTGRDGLRHHPEGGKSIMTRDELEEAITFMEGAGDLADLADRLWQAVDAAAGDAGSMREVLTAALAEIDRVDADHTGGDDR